MNYELERVWREVVVVYCWTFLQPVFNLSLEPETTRNWSSNVPI
jgi:hypothetical protein